MNVLRIFIGLLTIMILSRSHACESCKNDSTIIESEGEVIDKYIIQIDNQAEDNYYFWVNPTPVGQTAPRLLVRRYLWSIPNGYDFSFGHLLIEPNIEFSNYNISLGYNFIKLLLPGESFQLIIISNSKVGKYYEDCLVIMSEKEFKKYSDTVPDFFLYKGDHIVVTDAEIPIGV